MFTWSSGPLQVRHPKRLAAGSHTKTEQAPIQTQIAQLRLRAMKERPSVILELRSFEPWPRLAKEG